MLKKICAVLLTLSLLGSAALTGLAQSELPPPDVNGDGKSNAVDALLVLQYAVDKAQLTQEQKAVADRNTDGAINAADALLILQYSIDPPITPFPPLKTEGPVAYTFDPDNCIRHADRVFAQNNIARLCITAQQLAEQLENLSMDQTHKDTLTALGEQFDFESKSLLLVGFLAASSEVKVTVKSLVAESAGWHLQLQESGGGGLQALEHRLYWMEVEKHYTQPLSLYCTVTKGDAQDGPVDFEPIATDGYIPYVSKDFSEKTVAVICNTYDEMVAALSEQLGASTEDTQPFCERYSADYFSTQSIVLLGKYYARGGTKLEVKGLSQTNGALKLHLNLYEPIAATGATVNRVYFIELKEKIQTPTQYEFTFDYYAPDIQNGDYLNWDGTYAHKKTVTE